MNNLTEEQIQVIKQLQDDFAFRVKSTLKIKDKEGRISSFQINDVQKFIHEQCEDQLRRTGRVRKIVLKGRKQGCSTYVAARFFDRMMREAGIESFILAHREDTVDTLYDIVKRFHEAYPDYKVIGEDEKGIICKQEIIQQNAKQFTFKNSSGYAVGTAGKGEIGRGFTIQQLHLSEAAFYEAGEKISAGIMKAVPDSEGTEIIVESTANGIGNLFFNLVQKAKLKQGSFELIFIPWYWQLEYRRKLPEDFYITDEEMTYKEIYGLDDEQVYWRRIEIQDSDGGIKQFKREYPATIEEAFEASQDNAMFNIDDILQARHSSPIQDGNRIIIGLDVAGSGQGDRTVFKFKKGRNIFRSEVYRGWDTTAIIGRTVQILREYNPIMIFIDKGYNPGVYDGLIARGWSNRVIGVNFGGSADEPNRFANKRAEMYYRLSKFIEDKPCSISCEGSEQLQNELMLTEKKPPDSHGRLILISKDDIKKKHGHSPDLADAAALCFAFLIATYDDLTEKEKEEEEEERETRTKGRNSCSGY